MESNNTKVEMMKPLFVKAGIPLAITLVGYIIAKITTRKFQIFVPSTTQENSQEITNQNLDDGDHSSTSTLYKDSTESFLFQEKLKFQEDILRLRRQTQDIEEREHQLEARFQHYTHLKDQEIALMIMQNNLELEINKIDLVSKEITLVEADSQRFENMVSEYLRIKQLLDLSKSENRLLHRRVKKLLKKIKAISQVMKEQRFQLEAKETEISRNHQELEMKDDTNKKMELEIQQLKMAFEQLQEERAELAETSNPSKKEVELVNMEDYKELVNELEQVQKEKSDEDKELIYLRWCNACLRHELMRRNQQIKHDQELNLAETSEFVVPQPELTMRRSSSVGNDHYSKRKKLIQKFKKWVEGSDKMKHETNCFKRNSISNCSEDLILPSRKSCSSA